MKLSFSFQIIFSLIILANVCMWFYARPIQPKWQNVPPAPSDFSAHVTGLGDNDLSYRMIGFMLQNIGKVDGRTENLRSYDYARLKNWFFAAYKLQPLSNYVPMLATYYYGATTDPQQAREVIDFLKVAGNDSREGRWRWLVQGIFLARHKVKDLDLALELAEKLRDLKTHGKPAWANMMPAMILNSKGEKQDALIMLKSMLETSSKELHPAEINFLISYICEQILNPEEAAKERVCELNKP